jgi:hemoglobin
MYDSRVFNHLSDIGPRSAPPSPAIDWPPAPDVRASQRPLLPEPAKPGGLYERVGYAGGLHRLAAGLYERVLDDPALMGYFEHMTGHGMKWLRWHLLTFLAVVTDGPHQYAGRDLRAAHTHLHITGAAFDRLCAHLRATMATVRIGPTEQAAILAELEQRRPDIVGFDPNAPDIARRIDEDPDHPPRACFPRAPMCSGPIR